MKRWVPRPERPPFACPFTFQDSEADGPYLETRLTYLPLDDQGEIAARRPFTLVISPQALREAALLPDSPIAVVDRDTLADLETRANAFEEENADLAAQLEEARAEISSLREHQTHPIDMEALGNFLDTRYARRTGPKPKAKV